MARPKLELIWVPIGSQRHPEWDTNPSEFIEKLQSCIDENKTIDVLELILTDNERDLSELVQNFILDELVQNDNQIIRRFQVNNACQNEDNSNAGLNFLIQCLEASRNITIKSVDYGTMDFFPMTLNDSKRLASAISNSNDALKSFYIHLYGRILLAVDDDDDDDDDGKYIFSNENTLENIFKAVLDKGLQLFTMYDHGGHRNEIFLRVCSAGNSQLATNTTLKKLRFLDPPQRGDQHVEERHPNIFSDEQINALSMVLKTNTGLTDIALDSTPSNVSDEGRTNLFRALRCNTTLTGRLSFDGVPLSDDRHPKTIEEHIKLNKWWQSFKSKYNIGFNKNKKTTTATTTTTTTNIGTGTIAPPNANAVQGQPQPKSLTVSLYPDLIMNKLGVKPQFLYEVLQSETPTLVGATAASTTTAAIPSSVGDIEKERDFYFGKLRSIELFLQIKQDKHFENCDKEDIVSNLFRVLYATVDDDVQVGDDGEVVPISQGETGNVSNGDISADVSDALRTTTTTASQHPP